jgi:phosphoribosylglycinamide formyltransferase-1
MKPKIIIFATGTAEGGGSGFENLVAATRLRQGSGEASKDVVLDAEIVAVVSNHEHGGVRERADRLGVSFIYFVGPYDAERYQKIVADSGAEWIALSGWLKKISGLDPAKTFNIHPALLSQLGRRFGGEGMWGHHVHEAVKLALDAGEIQESGCSMHFVTDEYDRGPVFFEHPVPLTKGMTAEQIQKAVNVAELEWQPKITSMVVHGEIRWDGKDPQSLVVPKQ